LKRIRIERGTKDDFKELEQFHYRHGSLMVRAVYRAVLDGKIIGVIVYGPTYPNLSARRITLPQFSGKMDSTHMRTINKNFVRIWRVVVDPKYRSIGLGVKLVRETLERVGYPYVEILAVMGQYNPFAEKAGMIRVPMELYTNNDQMYLKALDKIRKMGFDLDLLRSKTYDIEHIDKLSPKQLDELKQIIIRYFLGIINRRRKGFVGAIRHGSKDAIAAALANHKLPYAYAIWKNPRFRNLPDPIYCDGR